MSATNSFVTEQVKRVYQGALTVTGNARNLTVKVDDRAKVKAAIYALWDKDFTPYVDVKSTKSSFNVTEMIADDGSPIQIVWKNTVGGGGSGAGAEITALAESAQAWYCAVAFNGRLDTADDFVAAAKGISAKCYTTNSLEDVIKKLPDDWVDSSIKIANYMKKMIQFHPKLGQYFFHRGSKHVDKISEMFLSANRKEKMFANLNKWSPADIWLMTLKGQTTLMNAPSDQTFASLNGMITKLYESGDVIGVSLKKIGQSAHHEVFNYKAQAAVCKFSSFKVSGKSKDGYIQFQFKDDPNMSIQFRSFSDTGSWQGEIKGKYASGGKIGGGVAAMILNRVTGRTISAADAKTVTQAVQRGDKKITDAIKANAKTLGVLSLEDPDKQSNDWKYSKFLTTELFTVLKGLTADKRDAFLRECVGYAASSSEAAAVFIKMS